MRIRVIGESDIEIDGVSLATFEVGCTYDVPTAIATYLIAMGGAEPVLDVEPAEIRHEVNPSMPSMAHEISRRLWRPKF